MRRTLVFGIGLALLASLALVSTAMAQATTPVVQGMAQKELIKTLRSAHRLLVAADHDYDGHRAKAAKEVHNALKELGYQHKKVQPASTPANGAVVAPKAGRTGQPRVHEPQANSDAQLLEAKGLLQGALTQLTGKHPTATAKVKAAIAEINTALSIK
jgi:hypothetical protein